MTSCQLDVNSRSLSFSSMLREHSGSVFAHRTKHFQCLFDWHSPVTSLQQFLKKFEPQWYRAYNEGRQILQWFLWKHHFTTLDTSNVNSLPWLTIPGYFGVPKPSINHLPNEILTIIFALSVHSDSSEPKDRFCHQILRRISSGSSPTTPLLLTHVCPFWRMVVQDTPTLWSTIMVLCPVGADIDYISFLLSKTSNCPLTLGLEQYVTPDQASLSIAKLFLAQAHRWKRINFTFMKCIQGPFLDLRPNDVPLLEEYRVRIESWDAEYIDSFFHALHSSSTLNKIDWGKSLSGQLRDDSPWCQLSEITLHCMELSQTHLEALSRCFWLKTLKMRRMQKTIFTHRGPIVLNQLERFVCDRPDSFASVFDLFTMPLLCDMEITSRCPFNNEDITSLIAIITRSHCFLKTLSIDGHSMFILPILPSSFLQTTTTLKILSDVMEKGLTLLTRRGTQTDLLPNLQDLILHNCRTDDGVLAAVIWSRRNGLRTFQLCVDLTTSPQDQMTLRRLEKDGLLVSVYEPVASFSTFYFRGNPREPGGGVIPMLHVPDLDTLW